MRSQGDPALRDSARSGLPVRRHPGRTQPCGRAARGPPPPRPSCAALERGPRGRDLGRRAAPWTASSRSVLVGDPAHRPEHLQVPPLAGHVAPGGPALRVEPHLIDGPAGRDPPSMAQPGGLRRAPDPSGPFLVRSAHLASKDVRFGSGAAGSLLRGTRRRPHRLRGLRDRPADARLDLLAEPPPARLGQPGLAALPRPGRPVRHHHPLRRARLRALRLGRDRPRAGGPDR